LPFTVAQDAAITWASDAAELGGTRAHLEAPAIHLLPFGPGPGLPAFYLWGARGTSATMTVPAPRETIPQQRETPEHFAWLRPFLP